MSLQSRVCIAARFQFLVIHVTQRINWTSEIRVYFIYISFEMICIPWYYERYRVRRLFDSTVINETIIIICVIHVKTIRFRYLVDALTTDLPLIIPLGEVFMYIYAERFSYGVLRSFVPYATAYYNYSQTWYSFCIRVLCKAFLLFWNITFLHIARNICVDTSFGISDRSLIF